VLTDGAWEKSLISPFIPTVPGLKEELERGINCLDVGCGTGTAALLLASAFPNSQIYGVDIAEDAIKTATNRAREKSLSNIQFIVSDARQLPDDWTSKFSYVTALDSVHDQARPDLSLREILRILKPGGRFSAVDIKARSNVYDNKDDPKASFTYTASLFHCMPVSLYFPDGLGLGNMWGVEKANALLKDAGFNQVTVLDLPWSADINVHYLCTKPASSNL